MKPWYESKTIKFNIGAALAAIVAVLSLPETKPLLDMLPESWQPWLAVLVPFLIAVGINIKLRLVTTQPIGTPQPPPKAESWEETTEAVLEERKEAWEKLSKL